MRRAPLLLAIVALTACSPAPVSEPDPDRPWEETFEGHVWAINGTPVEESFRIIFYSTDEDPAPERYVIRSECIDTGYFDEDHQAFLSGHSPVGQGADKISESQRQEMMESHRRRCPADTAVVYNRLLDLMYEGAVLSLDGDRARLASKDGLSADLVRVPQTMLMD